MVRATVAAAAQHNAVHNNVQDPLFTEHSPLLDQDTPKSDIVFPKASPRSGSIEHHHQHPEAGYVDSHLDGSGDPADSINEDSPSTIPNDPSMVQVDKKQSVWQIFWKVLIGLFALLLLALGIKGFVQSGDGGFDWGKAGKKALGGGLSGAAAMVLQVLTLMPLRTIMNYQYRYGTSTREATKTLYRDGGYKRYYSGLGAAIIQGPVSRFGDTAANAFALAFLSSSPYTRDLPTLIQSAFGSLMAALFRIGLTPVDTVKTTLQTKGKSGWGVLKRRIKTNGIGSMWYGALATAAATFVGHFPWFGTYNFLQVHLPPLHPASIASKLFRQALIGFIASVISDSVSNSLRVVKTYRQVEEGDVGYAKAARTIIATEGVRGLLGRGLKTRILANGLQGLLFSVLWKLFMDLWDKETNGQS